MPKLLIVVLVAIAALFVVGVGLSMSADEQIDPERLDSSCRRGSIFSVLPNATCEASVPPAHGGLPVINLRQLKVVLQSGGPIDIQYDHLGHSPGPLKKLDRQTVTLPKQEGDDRQTQPLMILGSAGKLSFRCRGPVPCTIAMR